MRTDNTANGIVFEDEHGNYLESWQVPLEIYVEARGGNTDESTAVHRTVVARAIARGKDVSEDILAQHDRVLLDQAIELESRLQEAADRQLALGWRGTGHGEGELFD